MISTKTKAAEIIIPDPRDMVSASTPPTTPMKQKKQMVAIMLFKTEKNVFEEIFSKRRAKASRADAESSSFFISIILQLLL